MSNQQQFEDIIRTALVDKAEKASTSDNMFENIKYEIQSNKGGKKFMLKEKFLPLNLNIKKSIIAALCGVFIITGSIFTLSPNIRASAIQSIDKHVNGYTGIKNYDKAPSKDELKRDLGYEIKMPASLPEGYKLVDSDIDGHVDGSAPPDKQYDEKQATAIYSKDIFHKNTVSLGVSKVNTEDDSPIFKNAKKITIGNTTAYWTEYKVHILPIDMFNKMSQQQKNALNKASESGKEILITAGGKNERKLNEQFKTAHSLKWTDNNVNYQLTDQSNKLLTFEQMSQMAESIINSK